MPPVPEASEFSPDPDWRPSALTDVYTVGGGRRDGCEKVEGAPRQPTAVGEHRRIPGVNRGAAQQLQTRRRGLRDDAPSSHSTRPSVNNVWQKTEPRRNCAGGVVNGDHRYRGGGLGGAHMPVLVCCSMYVVLAGALSGCIGSPHQLASCCEPGGANDKLTDAHMTATASRVAAPRFRFTPRPANAAITPSASD